METKVMGVLRVAPDASAGGGPPASRAAVARGRELIADGADIIEIACAPTASGRPAPHPVMQARLVRAVVATLMDDVRVAVRTGSATVAAAAVGAGATLITDDPAIRDGAEARGPLPALAAEAGVGWVAVHDHGTPARRGGADDGDPSDPGRLLGEVAEALRARVRVAEAAGVQEIYVDPGIGTGRGAPEDLDILGGLEVLAGLDRPLVVGTGDGRLVDALHAAADTTTPAPDEAIGDGAAGRADRGDDRLEGALVVAVWAMLAGAAIVRTQHVAATVEAARTVGAKAPVGTP